MKFCSLLAFAVGTLAQDPANGWMAYAVGNMPSKYERITFMEMSWKVEEGPSNARGFYSPWFGMDPADNLNLIQPVNPWTGNSWAMYTEYYQWRPTKNSNSRKYTVKAGQTLHGSLTYDQNKDGYLLSQEIVETGATSTQNVVCQKGKKYTVPYVVYEKVLPCKSYPPAEEVRFTNITVECDGQDCTDEIVWEAKVQDANCNMTAHIIDAETISITWDTKAASKYDDMTAAQLYDMNMHGWAELLDLERPLD